MFTCAELVSSGQQVLEPSMQVATPCLKPGTRIGVVSKMADPGYFCDFKSGLGTHTSFFGNVISAAQRFQPEKKNAYSQDMLSPL